MLSHLRTATYKKYRNKLNHIIKLSEKRYYHDKFELHKNNISKSWSVIKDYFVNIGNSLANKIQSPSGNFRQFLSRGG